MSARTDSKALLVDVGVDLRGLRIIVGDDDERQGRLRRDLIASSSCDAPRHIDLGAFRCDGDPRSEDESLRLLWTQLTAVAAALRRAAISSTASTLGACCRSGQPTYFPPTASAGVASRDCAAPETDSSSRLLDCHDVILDPRRRRSDGSLGGTTRSGASSTTPIPAATAEVLSSLRRAARIIDVDDDVDEKDRIDGDVVVVGSRNVDDDEAGSALSMRRLEEEHVDQPRKRNLLADLAARLDAHSVAAKRSLCAKNSRLDRRRRSFSDQVPSDPTAHSSLTSRLHWHPALRSLERGTSASSSFPVYEAAHRRPSTTPASPHPTMPPTGPPSPTVPSDCDVAVFLSGVVSSPDARLVGASSMDSRGRRAHDPSAAQPRTAAVLSSRRYLERLPLYALRRIVKQMPLVAAADKAKSNRWLMSFVTTTTTTTAAVDGNSCPHGGGEELEEEEPAMRMKTPCGFPPLANRPTTKKELIERIAAFYYFDDDVATASRTCGMPHRPQGTDDDGDDRDRERRGGEEQPATAASAGADLCGGGCHRDVVHGESHFGPSLSDPLIPLRNLPLNTVVTTLVDLAHFAVIGGNAGRHHHVSATGSPPQPVSKGTCNDPRDPNHDGEQQQQQPLCRVGEDSHRRAQNSIAQATLQSARSVNVSAMEALQLHLRQRDAAVNAPPTKQHDDDDDDGHWFRGSGRLLIRRFH